MDTPILCVLTRRRSQYHLSHFIICLDAHRSGPASSICVYSGKTDEEVLIIRKHPIEHQVLLDFFDPVRQDVRIFYRPILFRVRISRT